MSVLWIADIGSNHNQDIERTLKLIDTAKEIGCQAVKFQLFDARRLFRNPTKEHLQTLLLSELPLHFLPLIRQECTEKGLIFICTPFDADAVAALSPFVDLYKVGSYEILCYSILEEIAKTQKSVILSTGMATIEEITTAIQIVKRKEGSVALLHCCSEYPAPLEKCNLIQIRDYHVLFPQMQIGWSDHTALPGVIYKAVSLGASIIEFHLDLQNRKGMEAKYGHCWYPSQIEKVIRTISIGEKACYASEDNEALQKKRMERTDPADCSRPIEKGGENDFSKE